MPIWTRVGWNCKHETLRHPYQSKLNPAIPSHWLVQKTALFSSCLAFSSRKVNQITKTISLYGWADQSPDARHGIAVLAASSCPCQNQWYSCCCRARSHCLQQLLYRRVDKSSASYHSLAGLIFSPQCFQLVWYFYHCWSSKQTIWFRNCTQQQTPLTRTDSDSSTVGASWSHTHPLQTWKGSWKGCQKRHRHTAIALTQT